jgi:hypothetical protein
MFFAELPPDPPVDETRQVFYDQPGMLPEHWLPGTLGRGAVVGRSDTAAVRLDVRDVFPRGMSFEVRAFLHPSSTEPAIHRHHHRPTPFVDDLRLGMLWPDGTSAEAGANWYERRDQPADGEPVLDARGGGGGGLGWSWHLWLHPLPASGPVTVYCRWDSRDIPETATELDLTSAIAAAADASELWPLPTFEEQPPEGGWFAYAPLGATSAYGSTLTFTPDGAASSEGSGDALDGQDEDG